MVQTQGRKRWRVYAPPDPSLAIGANPLARGKGRDVLPESALGAPLLDSVMEPGQLMYVPAGFPHTTSTELGTSPAEQGTSEQGGPEGPSVHLTLGVDTHLWGLSYMRLREVALARKGQSGLLEGRQLPTALGRAAYFELQHPLPLGMLGARALGAAGGAEGGGAGGGKARQAAERAALCREMALQCAARMLAVEPIRWAEHAGSAAGLADALGLEEAAGRMLQHYVAVMAAVTALCEGGAAGSGEPPLVRAQPLMGVLDDAQQALADWAEGREPAAPLPARAAANAPGAGAPAPAKAAKGAMRAKAAKGFGAR